MTKGFTYKWTLWLMACIPFSAFPQNEFTPKVAEGDIYALLIGVSDYQDESIKDLNYAHKDATAFADYLTSSSGGNVPNENIQLLINEQATISNIYAAINNLKDRLKSRDLLYFYFSGHGDVEEGLYNLGFFLAYDTPSKNYLTNAIRIEDINMMANELSVTKDVEVVLVTDACHSGRISGEDNKGNQLIGEQLSKTEENEVRLASCEPDQFSQEGEAWGNGRGVFSFYLLNGLMGKADFGEQDGVVTLSELRLYLEDKIPKDVSEIKNEDQVPVINGKGFSIMSVIDENNMNLIDDQAHLENTESLESKSIYQYTEEDQYYHNVSKIDILNEYDFSTWKAYGNAKIIREAIQLFKSSENDQITRSKWRFSLNTDKDAQKKYGVRLASVFHNAVQPIVNKQMEIKQRRFSNLDDVKSLINDLEKCVSMLNIAHKLVNKSEYLYKIIGVKKHYCQALIYRLQLPFTEDSEKLGELALEEQKKAIEYENRTGYLRFKTVYSKIETTKKTKKSY